MLYITPSRIDANSGNPYYWEIIGANVHVHVVQITGEYKSDWTQNYGLSLLVFNSSDKIQEVLTFMTPFPQQRRELLKAEE